jgi:hypothetical protein
LAEGSMLPVVSVSRRRLGGVIEGDPARMGAALRRELLHAAEWIGVGRRRRGRRHQAEALQKENGALRGASPNKLAPFSLAVLNVYVTA